MTALAWGPEAVEAAEPFTLHGTDDWAVDAVYARPETPPSRGLVVHPDIGGLRPLFEELVRRLASHGFAVMAFEPFGRLSVDERAAMDLPARMDAVADLVDADQIGDMTAAADALVDRDAVDRVAVLGFCMGGMYTLKAAATGRFDRAAPFYGMLTLPDRWRGPNHAEPLSTAPNVCPTIAILGGSDPWVPSADIEALREAWIERPDCEIVLYPDGEHGFVHDPDRPAHRPEDAADAWRRVLQFLAE